MSLAILWGPRGNSQILSLEARPGSPLGRFKFRILVISFSHIFSFHPLFPPRIPSIYNEELVGFHTVDCVTECDRDTGRTALIVGVQTKQCSWECTWSDGTAHGW